MKQSSKAVREEMKRSQNSDEAARVKEEFQK
jgi:hypothetical protein